MKKLLSLVLVSLILLGGYACARCKYDATGRHLIYNDTIRGRKQAAAAAKLKSAGEMAAAAKVNYDKEMAELDEDASNRANYIQIKKGLSRSLPESKLKSNYIQNPNYLQNQIRN